MQVWDHKNASKTCSVMHNARWENVVRSIFSRSNNFHSKFCAKYEQHWPMLTIQQRKLQIFTFYSCILQKRWSDVFHLILFGVLQKRQSHFTRFGMCAERSRNSSYTNYGTVIYHYSTKKLGHFGLVQFFSWKSKFPHSNFLSSKFLAFFSFDLPIFF